MIAVDTNVLVRLLVDDDSDSEQVAAARQAAEKAGRLHVSLVCLLETVWVLRSVFGITRPALQECIGHVLENRAYVLADEALVREAFSLWRGSRVDFPDALIWADAQRAGLELLSFDPQLLKQPGVLQPYC